MAAYNESSECCSCESLKKRIIELEEELHNLKSSNAISNGDVENNSEENKQNIQINQNKDVNNEKANNQSDNRNTEGKPMVNGESGRNQPPSFNKCELNNKDISRYSRQILLPEINTTGQSKLGKSTVLIVGAGGLGCPAALYLAACGIGCLGLVDYDVVELSNLQRQVLHGEDTEYVAKVDSAEQKLKTLNSAVQVDRYNTSISSNNCMDIIKKYDIVLDCSDNVATRYLLNDACIHGKKTLISGSALRWEGQLTVYNHDNGPCYRCLYPKPPPPEMVTNCSDAGVVGAVTGVIGSLQALEAIKIIIGENSSYAGKLLLFDGLSGSFRSIKLRGRVKDCAVCGDAPSITELQDYEQFCGSKANDKEKNWALLNTEYRISINEYCKTVSNEKPHLLLDVRPEIEYDICSLKGSVNIPLSDILHRKKVDTIMDAISNHGDIFVVCKRGNESQKAVLEILKYTEECGLSFHGILKDLIGGLTSWHKHIDSRFPVY